MSLADSVTSVYSDARAEYMRELSVHLVPAYFQFYIQLLGRAKQSMTDSKKVLWQFQNLLKEIPEWNMDKVSIEIGEINRNSGCDYIEDLLTAVFIAHTKVLTAIRISSKQKRVQITVPKVEHFLFRVLCESSKILWRSAYLFSDSVPGIERQQNYRTIEQLLDSSVQQSVRSMVPVKSILKDFVSQEDTDSPDDHVDDLKNGGGGIKDQGPVVAEMDNSVSETATNDTASKSIVSDDNTCVESACSRVEPIEPHVVDTDVGNSMTEPIFQPIQQPQQPQPSQQPPIIIVDTSNTAVEFTDFDTVYDSENPEESDTLFEPKGGENEEGDGSLKILENSGNTIDKDISLDYINLE